MPHTYLLIFKQLRNKKNKNCPLLIQSVSRFDTLTLRKERNKIYRDASFFCNYFAVNELLFAISILVIKLVP